MFLFLVACLVGSVSDIVWELNYRLVTRALRRREVGDDRKK